MTEKIPNPSDRSSQAPAPTAPSVEEVVGLAKRLSDSGRHKVVVALKALPTAEWDGAVTRVRALAQDLLTRYAHGLWEPRYCQIPERKSGFFAQSHNDWVDYLRRHPTTLEVCPEFFGICQLDVKTAQGGFGIARHEMALSFRDDREWRRETEEKPHLRTLTDVVVRMGLSVNDELSVEIALSEEDGSELPGPWASDRRATSALRRAGLILTHLADPAYGEKKPS